MGLARAPVHTVGRYALYDEIASGGMATVHYARLIGEVGFSRTVAVKRLHPQYAKNEEFVARFVDEARLTARVVHPNVVQVFDIASFENELFLVMEYVPGQALSSLVKEARKRGERIPLAVVSAIMCGVLHGLHAAHEAVNENGEPLHIVHRDVTPQNVLVGSDGVPRVLDFGVAKAVGRLHTTRDGQLRGKLPYMAPEQLRDGTIGRATDVYAAGVVLWELLTQRSLFGGESEGVVFARILERPVEPPSALAFDVPKAIDAVALRAVSRDPAKRYATAREMALALEAAAPMASATGVGAWVKELAGDVLAARAAVVADIESSSYKLSRPPPPAAPAEDARSDKARAPFASSSTLDAAQVEPRAEPARRAWWLAPLAGVLVGGAVVAAGVVRGRMHARAEVTPAASPAPPAPVALAPSPAAPPASAPAAPLASAPAAPLATPDAPSAPPRPLPSPAPRAAPPRSAAARAAIPAAAPPASAPPAPPASAKPCTVDWYLDSAGIKHYTKDCP